LIESEPEKEALPSQEFLARYAILPYVVNIFSITILEEEEENFVPVPMKGN
jgi:hypothetical protein